MNMPVLLAVLGVGSVWGVVALSIWHWGPGQAKRSVFCPARQRRAQVVVEQGEGDFGCLRATDAVACSLFPSGPLNCNKDCVLRF